MKSNMTVFPQCKRETHGLVQKVPSCVRRLAAGLVGVMQIREGHELVHLIGNGDEYSNQRAVETWLMTHYPNEQVRTLAETLVTLSKVLKTHIEDHYTTLEVHSC